MFWDFLFWKRRWWWWWWCVCVGWRGDGKERKEGERASESVCVCVRERERERERERVREKQTNKKVSEKKKLTPSTTIILTPGIASYRSAWSDSVDPGNESPPIATPS